MASNLWFAITAVVLLANPEGTIRFTTADKMLEFAPDGTRKSEKVVARHDPLEKQLSPDGKLSLYSKDGTLYVADSDGSHAKRISPEGQRCSTPTWSPDGNEIAFSVLKNDQWQLATMAADGTKLKQLTDWPAGIERPRYSPDGKLSYMRMKVYEGKFQPADLMLIEKAEHKVLVEDQFISDYAWGPDEKTLAYGKLHALVFLDVAAGKSETVTLASVSDQLFHHAPTSMAWSPDGKAIACRLPAHVGRAATFGNEPPKKIFGDDELFVIPREGEARWFLVGDVFGKLEWVK